MLPLAALAYTVFLWWFSTGAILWLDRRPRATYPFSLAAGTAVAAVAALGIVGGVGDASPAGAVLAFTCALAIWGWHELTFLTGAVTGPSRAPCPPGARGWRRFALAARTLIWHELALALTAAAIAAFGWGRPNPVAAWTFAILFAARLSAKLNLFLGAPNFDPGFFPDHLKYLTTYLRRGRTSALFPVSVLAGGVLAAIEAALALEPGAGAYQATAMALLFALTALALIEHGFMALPIRDAALWRWAAPLRPKTEAGNSPYRE